MDNKTSYYSITILNAINNYLVKDEKGSKWNLYFTFRSICSLFFFFLPYFIDEWLLWFALFLHEKKNGISTSFIIVSQRKKNENSTWSIWSTMNSLINREWLRFNIASSNLIDLARSCKLTSDKYYTSYFANKRRKTLLRKHRWGSHMCVRMCVRL